MRWSKLKQTLEARMAPSLAGRVRLHTAHYHDAPDTEGRGWITVDGEEIIMFCQIRGTREQERVKQEYLQARPDGTAAEAQKYAREWAKRSGSMTQSGYYGALREYLFLSIDEALASPNVLIRALAMVDSRTGKRRLRKLSADDLAHPLVTRLYAIRCEAEGLRALEGTVNE